jgi:protein-disulfide isomerase
MERDLNQIITDYPNRVRVVWKDYPNEQAHPDAFASAKAARCAGLQGAFWQYHEMLLANQSATGIENHVIMAGQLGLDTESFRSCAASETMRPLILRDAEEAVRLRIDATPHIFIGDRRVSGAIGYDLLKVYVDSSLNALVPTAPASEPNSAQ